MNKLIFIGSVCFTSLSFGQTSIDIIPYDTVELTIPDEDITWEQSQDGESWIETGINGSYLKIMVQEVPTFFRGKHEKDGCAPTFTEEIEINSEYTNWSNPNTWESGEVPQAGDFVVIPEDKKVILDINTPQLAGLEIDGELRFREADITLTCDYIIVRGVLNIGEEELPFKHNASITLTASDTAQSIMGMGTRGIVVLGSLNIISETPDILWTKIDDHIENGGNQIKLSENTTWSSGDEIVIGPTDYYEAGFGVAISESAYISDITENSLTTTTLLSGFRWGQLQYITNDGLSLSNENSIDPPIADTDSTSTPLVLDERAPIGLLTRNVVIQAPDDEIWQNAGFGVHIMIMPGATAKVDGVEIKRGGQAGRLRRYPFHWHMLSYSGTETLDDASGQYLKNSVINQSMNRGIVIHGTNGITVDNNIVYDIRGHGIFLENAVERRNIINNNLVLHVRNPEWGIQLMQHEVGTFGSSGFWITNPDNTITNNLAADCETFGFWLAFPEIPFAESAQVLADDGEIIRPNRLLFGEFDNNTAHSNKNDGLHLDDPQIDEEGNTNPIQYWSTSDGRTDINTGTPENIRRFTLSRMNTWKNLDNGSWDRGALTDIIEFVSADNCGRFFAGSGAEGFIDRSLIIGTSLNYMQNGTGRPDIADFQFYPSSSPVAFATYHSAFSMNNNIVVNFEVTAYDRAGVFASDDYYLRPVEKGMSRNTNNLLINAHPGVKLQASNGYFTLASALWDPYGFWGPEGNYIVYNDPFLTYGKTITNIDPGPDVVGGVSVEGPFYGFRSFVLHGSGPNPPQNYPWLDLMAIHVNRFDPEDLNNPVASWEVDAADISWALNHMRDFATSPSGIYELTFPEEDHPTDFYMEVENMLETTDTQVIGIQFDGAIDPVVYVQQVSNVNNFQVYTMLESREEVINSEGETFWLDQDNNIIWVKLQGGRWVGTAETNGDFEAESFETMYLRIRTAD